MLFARFALIAAIALPLLSSSHHSNAAPPKIAATATTSVSLQGDARIVHALNRLGFGPRPGDVEAVRQMGLARWIESQLHPETIDDSALQSKLDGLTTLRFSSTKLHLAYQADSAAFLRVLLDQKAKDGDATRRGARKIGGRNMDNTPITLVGVDLSELKPQQRQLLRQIENSSIARGTSVQAVGELSNAKIARAAHSKRQLQEVLVDFWGNHFNLDVKKGLVRTAIVVDDRTVIRPHALGRFRDLLGASAKSPAMLFYLDNFRSTRTAPVGMQRRNPKKKMAGGLNENYARELMELHTLGVDGGYTQRDVQEVARCLTGWTLDRKTGQFSFRALWHDSGEKIVLGQTIRAGGGIEDGERVLDILAAHPSTARHLARKLCVRLVSDQPSKDLVERAAQAYLKSDGDLRATIQSIVYAPQFFQSATARTKIKSPFELAISAVRALDGTIAIPDATRPFGRLRLIGDGGASMGRNRGKGRGRDGSRSSLAQSIAGMGQPLFGYQAPTGYAEDSRTWVSTGALIARLNFTLALSGGEIANVQVAPKKLLEGVAAEDADAVLNRLFARLIGGEVSPATRATLKKQIVPGTPADAVKMTALVLGTPEFQRR